MESSHWLIRRIRASGGSISFYEYMDWVLNDPKYGAYGIGNLKIGKEGDFVTSPSLGNEFASILITQLADWIYQIKKNIKEDINLSIIDIGPGEGDLIFDLICGFKNRYPDLIKSIEFVLIELNKGMIDKQKKKFESLSNVSIRWCSINQLVNSPVTGVLIANEFFDALPVERVILKNRTLYRQGVTFETTNDKYSLTFADMPLTEEINSFIYQLNNSYGTKIPPDNAGDCWTTEIHIDLYYWLERLYKCLNYGTILIIDYMLEAYRYYAPSRISGTMISYRNQIASNDLFSAPGYSDLTSHLCIEAIDLFSRKAGLNFLGSIRQGEALLALGLAKEINSLHSYPKEKLKTALEKRENLLRLVDPRSLGEFRWIALEKKYNKDNEREYIDLNTMFLSEPV